MVVRRKNTLVDAWQLPEGWSKDIPEWAERAKVNGRLVWLDVKKIWTLNGHDFVALPGDYIIYEKDWDVMRFCKAERFHDHFEEVIVGIDIHEYEEDYVSDCTAKSLYKKRSNYE